MPVPDNRRGNETSASTRDFNGLGEDNNARTQVDGASKHRFHGAHQPTNLKGAGPNHNQGIRKMVHTWDAATGDVSPGVFDHEGYVDPNVSTRLEEEGSTQRYASRNGALSGRRQDDEPWNKRSEDTRSDPRAIYSDRLIMSRSSILRPDGFGRRLMLGSRAKRARETDDDEQQDRSVARTKHPRISTITIHDIDIPEDYFFVMESCEAKDEYRAVRAYMSEVCSRLRADMFNDKDFVKSQRTSRSLEVVGWIILIPVVEFRKRKGPPEDEHLTWLDIPEGTLVVKLRPALACKNGHDSIRTKPLTSFGDSDPYTQWIDDREQGIRPKLRDYVPLFEHPPQPGDAGPEGLWIIGPLYFRSTSDYDFDRRVRFAHIYTHHNHPHTVPWKKIGELYWFSDFQEFVRMEETAASDLVNPVKKALMARTEGMSGHVPKLNAQEANTAFHPVVDDDNQQSQSRSLGDSGLQEVEESASMLDQKVPAQSILKSPRQMSFEELGWGIWSSRKDAAGNLERQSFEMSGDHIEQSSFDLEVGHANGSDSEGNSRPTASGFDHDEQSRAQQRDDWDLDVWPPPSPDRLTHLNKPKPGYTTLAGYLNERAHIESESLDHLYSLSSGEPDDTQTYQEEICTEYQQRREGWRGPDCVSSTNESQSLGKSGDIGTFAVAQFTEIPGQTGDEVLDWWPHKEGISVVKLRPGLICENAWWGLRVRLFWGFGDSDPRLVRVKNSEGVYQAKLADYVQVLLYPSSNVRPEPTCFAPPVYFHPTVGDYAWNKEERFMHVHNCYVHLHSSPYRIVGRLHGREDFQAHVALEKATASRLSASAEKALREFGQEEVESDEESKLASTTEDNRSPILDCPGECEVDSDPDENISTAMYLPSAEAQLLADEAEEEVEREFTRSDPQGFGLGSLMSRARRFGVESEASAPDIE
ncbi:hypothetical protein KC335_g10501 [Hortaea werneckii]|nr:hypothetical protein KC335_g10501 [Hortaea werneckii]KAI7450301.1 hypothetical protein KC368_g4734 [Hortaea werneckii]